MLDEADIVEALRACSDPEIPLDVVELGLVDGVALAVDQDAPGAGIEDVPVRQRLTVRLLVTSEDEEKQAMLKAQVMNRLGGVEGLSRVTVEIAPGWTAAKISAAGRKRLGLDAGPFRVLNNRVGG